ncbi:MAG: 50S ribosomal protein L31e [Nitrososphaeria archaeon]
MSEKEFEERTIVIPLWKTHKTGSYRRAKKALSVLREEVSKVVKDGNFVIDSKLNEQIWAQGIRRPPRRITVKVKKDEEGNIIVSLP